MPSASNDMRTKSPADIMLVGPFDPATVALSMHSDAARLLSKLSGPPAVPIHQLARGLANRGIRTTVLGGLQQAQDTDAQSSALRVIVYHRRGTGAFILNGWRRERKLILERLREICPSVVHAHWTLEGARAVADWTGPKVLTVHDAAYECARLSCTSNPVSLAFFARWLRNTSSILKRFRHVIAVSPFIETYLRLQHRFQGDIRVIPNPIVPLPASLRVPDTFPKGRSLTFGCYGGPGRLKNVGAALNAYMRVEKQLPHSRMLVFGEGWGCGARYAGSRIEFRGALAHSEFLRCLASEVDIWVHPSRIEAHPITLLEAIQAGCPVIAGKASGGVPWTLDYGRAGVLVDVEDPDQIATGMMSLATDRERAVRIVAYGRRMILDRFSPDRVLDMHLNYYREIIAQWNSSSMSTQLSRSDRRIPD